MVINTESSEGLVVWHGNLSGSSKDFLAVAINDGSPTVTFNLGSGPNAIFGASKINDGADHLVPILSTFRPKSFGQLFIVDLRKKFRPKLGTNIILFVLLKQCLYSIAPKSNVYRLDPDSGRNGFT
jgi:hypothetical protein